METKPKKREWVKNAAIILLAVLLVLTFFSNTIMNRSLPEVSTQYVTDGKINVKVRGTGIVMANGNHQVKAEQTREIRAVMVKVGQRVEAGDVLFVLGSGESAEIQEAQEQLRQLQLTYQRTALSGSYSDYTADEIRLEEARKAAEEAMLLRDAVVAAETDGSQRMTRLREELDKAVVTRDRLKEGYEQEQTAAESAFKAAQAEWQTAENEVIQAQGWEEPLTEEQRALLDDPEKGLEAVQNDEELDETARTKLLEKWNTLLDKTRELASARERRNSVSRVELDAAEQRILDIQAEIEQAIGESANYKAAQEAYIQAETTYLDMLAALESRKESDARSSAQIGLELAELSRQIEEQRAKLEELSGGEENQIVASVPGTIQSIECTAGDTVPKDSVLCVIEVPDMGYTLSFSVTNEQASRLKIGDSGTISNYYWGSEIVATLESIRVDPKNPQTNKVLTFDVTGDVNAGTELSISVGQRSANYDVIIPRSAIHSDTNGSFVYKIEARNSPLGNRYVARRVSVEILAEDDNSAAVRGDLGWGDYVITTSNAPLKNGDLVRLAD